MEKLCNALCMILFLAGTGGFYAKWFFLARLRKLHVAKWEQLGRPVSFAGGIFNTGKFVRFIWRKDYESLSDEKTLAFARFLRTYYFFSAILCALTALVMCMYYSQLSK